jgi:hypothetical protein
MTLTPLFLPDQECPDTLAEAAGQTSEEVPVDL